MVEREKKGEENMMNKYPKRFAGTFPALLISSLITTAAFAENPVIKLNKLGNRQVEHELYDEALESYKTAKTLAPEKKELDYNIGSVLARKNQLSEASENFSKIDPRVNRELYGRARYNTGVMNYRLAEKLVEEQKLQEAVDALDESLDAYRDSIRADRQDEDSKFNYQLAKRKKEQVDRKSTRLNSSHYS